MRAWTCKIGRIDKLYAFSYLPQRPEKDVDGWSVYDAKQEWKRLGISDKGADKGWRISNINTDYGVGVCLFSENSRIALNEHSSLQPILLYFLYHLLSPTIHSIMLEDIGLEFGCQY